MKRLVLFAVFPLALLAMPVFAGEAEWNALMDAGNTAYEKGDYETARIRFEDGRREAEASFGPGHPYVAKSLNNLALLYNIQGQYALAEPLYRRSLAIWEKVLGPEHSDVALGLNNLAGLYQDQGRYAEAEPLFKRSLAIRGNTLGPEHPDVAQSLNNLALLYNKQGQYAIAEPLHRRSLAIMEKTFGAEHPNVAVSLNNLALLYDRQGQYALAEPLYQRSLAIREKSLGPEHPDVAVSLNNLAELYRTQGQYVLAEPLYQRSLAITEKVFGPEHPDVALRLHNLAGFYVEKGKYAQAEPAYRRSLAIWEKALGSEHPRVALSLNSLALLYSNQGQYALAEPLYQRSLAIREKSLGPEHPDVAVSLNNLAELYRTQGQYVLAEPLYQRSLAITEKVFGHEHPDVAVSLNNLALLYSNQGQYALAEPLYRRSLAIREKSLGSEHPDVANSLINLAENYRDQGQNAQAEPFLKRSLAIMEKSLGPEHPNVGVSLNSLALLYSNQGQYALAEPLFNRSLAIGEKALGPEHPNVATSLNNLADLYRNQGQYALAEPLFNRSLAIGEKALGPEHPNVATSLNNLADLYRNQGQYALAEPLFNRSLAIGEKALGPEHPAVATSLNNLAWVYHDQGRHADVLPPLRHAIRIYTTRFSLKDESAQRGLRAEQHTVADKFEGHVGLLLDAGVAAGPPGAVAAETFEVAQWARASNTAEQVVKMAARHAAGSDALAKVAREKQDLHAYLEKLEADRLAEVSKPTAERNAERGRQLKLAEADTKDKLSTLDARIAKEFPRYGELTQPRPLSVEAAQKLLGDEEALLLWLVIKDRGYLWVLRRDKVLFKRIELNRAELDTAVRTLRLRLDLGASNRPDLLLAQPFDAVRAHELYRKLFSSAEALLGDVKHLILVPDGALQSLPPAVLVSEAPKTPVVHSEVAWLINKYALTVLPSVSSLRALRVFERSAAAGEPMIGFGDPVLEGTRSTVQGQARSRMVPAGIISRGLVADPKEVRRMEPLPDTADELKRIAVALKAPPKALYLGAQATESKVKQIDLARARVLAFATHGLMAEEFRGMAEPALVLTPPQQASEVDDGLLTASEISQLKLNADWVVLSACNTAASDGKPGAEGLSGLARAFFYAGARALMVSHWAVETNASAALTTGVFDQSGKGQSKAEALRQSMFALMRRGDIPHAHHPAMWAPFIVVGE